MKVEVDAHRCSGHGRCYTLAPEVFSFDDDGYCAERGTTVDVAPEQEAAAMSAVDTCPEGVFTVVAP